MTQYLCNIKISSTNCLTKKYKVPFFTTVLKDKIVIKYMDRPQTFESLTLAQYARYYCNDILYFITLSQKCFTFFIPILCNKYYFLAFLTFLLRQFKTSNDVPAPYSPDTKVLLGINTYKFIQSFYYILIFSNIINRNLIS